MHTTQQLLEDLAEEAGKNGSPRILAVLVSKLTYPEHHGQQFTLDLRQCPFPDVAKDRIKTTLQDRTWPDFEQKFNFVS